MNNGWIGTAEEFYEVLENLGADRDDDGKYVVGGNISSFMGAGSEFIVGADARYMKDGSWESLSDALRDSGKGLAVVVI